MCRALPDYAFGREERPGGRRVPSRTKYCQDTRPDNISRTKYCQGTRPGAGEKNAIVGFRLGRKIPGDGRPPDRQARWWTFRQGTNTTRETIRHARPSNTTRETIRDRGPAAHRHALPVPPARQTRARQHAALTSRALPGPPANEQGRVRTTARGLIRRVHLPRIGPGRSGTGRRRPLPDLGALIRSLSVRARQVLRCLRRKLPLAVLAAGGPKPASRRARVSWPARADYLGKVRVSGGFLEPHRVLRPTRSPGRLATISCSFQGARAELVGAAGLAGRDQSIPGQLDDSYPVDTGQSQ